MSTPSPDLPADPLLDLDTALALLERSLGPTRAALARVGASDLDRPTPCSRWSLGALLSHMDDGLDAFLDASSGFVEVRPVVLPGPALVGPALCDKACTLLGSWAQAGEASVAIGDRLIAGPILLTTAALEIAVHGWDVAASLGSRIALPEPLAVDLLDVVGVLVRSSDRAGRFGDPRTPPALAAPSARLLGFLGRAA